MALNYKMTLGWQVAGPTLTEVLRLDAGTGINYATPPAIGHWDDILISGSTFTAANLSPTSGSDGGGAYVKFSTAGPSAFQCPTFVQAQPFVIFYIIKATTNATNNQVFLDSVTGTGRVWINSPRQPTGYVAAVLDDAFANVLAGATSVGDGTAYHLIAMSCGGGTGSLFVHDAATTDGAANQTIGSSGFNATNKMQMGADYTFNVNSGFNGYLREFRIYSGQGVAGAGGNIDTVMSAMRTKWSLP